MVDTSLIHTNPLAYLVAKQPEEPIHFYAPSALTARARTFLRDFPGMVTFAVKANPDPIVLAQLISAGLHGFDVASPAEIRAIRGLSLDCPLHYNNPVRSRTEINFAWQNGVRSYSCDDESELNKLLQIVSPEKTEISIRFKLPVPGAAYDFGSKFGAKPAQATALLRQVSEMGFCPSLTFHPGTHCQSPEAYRSYIIAAHEIAQNAGIQIKRLNIGGGFPNARSGKPVDLNDFFLTIEDATNCFEQRPELVCEPGRSMVGDAFSLAARVKSVRQNAVFLNDGIYGSLSEFPLLGASHFRVFSENGIERTDQSFSASIFGPTCDSVDVLPGTYALPSDIAEGDFVIFSAMGAYVSGVSTNFNGYGARQTVMVRSL